MLFWYKNYNYLLTTVQTSNIGLKHEHNITQNRSLRDGSKHLTGSNFSIRIFNCWIEKYTFFFIFPFGPMKSEFTRRKAVLFCWRSNAEMKTYNHSRSYGVDFRNASQSLWHDFKKPCYAKELANKSKLNKINFPLHWLFCLPTKPSILNYCFA